MALRSPCFENCVFALNSSEHPTNFLRSRMSKVARYTLIQRRVGASWAKVVR